MSDDLPGNTHHNRMVIDTSHEDRIGADARITTYEHRTKDLGSGSNSHTIADGGVTLTGLKACATQSHTVVNGHVRAHNCGFTDDHPSTVVDEQALTDLGPRMDLNSRPKACRL
jgi:hypothetical protein